jgi:transposase InsO family protein
MTDNASEFKAEQFNQALSQFGAKHIYIRAGRPQSNCIAERFNLTMLEECWRPEPSPAAGTSSRRLRSAQPMVEIDRVRRDVI